MQKPAIIAKKATYTGVKVTSLYKALLHSEIKPHMSLQQQNEVSFIRNYYGINNLIDNKMYSLLWKYYFNFVMSNYVDPTRYKNV